MSVTATPTRPTLSVTEAARRLKTSRYMVLRYVASGDLQPFNVPGAGPRIDADSVARFAAARGIPVED